MTMTVAVETAISFEKLWIFVFSFLLFASASTPATLNGETPKHDYKDALYKSILFFEGQRSGYLQEKSRMFWRSHSALHDGSDVKMDLSGGYYDAGDNVKFNFPMAFTTTVLAWGMLDFRQFMSEYDRESAMEAIKWSTDYLLKCTSVKDVVYVQVGDPVSDHLCWERPEDMDTNRTSYYVTPQNPGSEVSAEIAAALASSSMLFKESYPSYAYLLLARAVRVFKFADKYRGSNNNDYNCPYYCDFNGYKDELIWGALWLYRATKQSLYFKYVVNNLGSLDGLVPRNLDPKIPYVGINTAEFGWDAKHAGINILLTKIAVKNPIHNHVFVQSSDGFVCTMMPESPTRTVSYSKGGLMIKPGGSNLQHVTANSFLLLTYARYLKLYNKTVRCGYMIITPSRMIEFVRSQVDYILGSNPENMSYMVGYGKKYPSHIHHRGSSVDSVLMHPGKISCSEGTKFFERKSANPNILVGAVVGGPGQSDSYNDSRPCFVQTEPTTYINAPLVPILAYLSTHT